MAKTKVARPARPLSSSLAASNPVRPGVQRSTKSTATADWLLPGERIDAQDVDVPSTVTDEELNHQYVLGEVRIVTESARYPLTQILEMLSQKVDTGAASQLRYDLDPEYQRRHRWSKQRKSRLIESFLMNIPVPPIFLYERDYAQFEVMDGRQRLNALAEFYKNDLILDGLEHWTRLNGRSYNTLPSKIREGINRRYISSIILLKETAKDETQANQLKKLVFERLNSGGVALSAQEARNAAYRGKLNDLCLELSANKEFREMWEIPEEYRADIGEADEPLSAGEKMFQRMDDVELVLRFFAYRHISEKRLGLNNISTFLDRFLQAGNKFPDNVLETYRTMFNATTSLLHSILGGHAFGRLTAEATPRPTKIVYDPLMFVASRYPEGMDRAALIRGAERLRVQLIELYRSDVFGGRRTNANHVTERNDEMEKAFRGVLQNPEP